MQSRASVAVVAIGVAVLARVVAASGNPSPASAPQLGLTTTLAPADTPVPPTSDVEIAAITAFMTTLAPSAPSTAVSTTQVLRSVSTTSIALDRIPRVGAGTITYARTGRADFGEGDPDLVFSVGVEDGVGLDIRDVVASVDATLGDPRSWAGDPAVALRREPDPDRAEVRLVVASADTVDSLCAPLRTNGIFSCARNGWVAINLDRWLTATDTWTADLASYRSYVINHEVGHYLFGPAHPGCPGAGEPAPVMMQQTKGLDGCAPNAWPYPG